MAEDFTNRDAQNVADAEYTVYEEEQDLAALVAAEAAADAALVAADADVVTETADVATAGAATAAAQTTLDDAQALVTTREAGGCGPSDPAAVAAAQTALDEANAAEATATNALAAAQAAEAAADADLVTATDAATAAALAVSRGILLRARPIYSAAQQAVIDARAAQQPTRGLMRSDCAHEHVDRRSYG